MGDAIAFDWLNGDLGTLRENYERVRAKPVPRDAAWMKAGGVDVLRFPGREEGGAAMVYFHGGGFIVGSPVTHADVAVRLVRHTDLPVCSVAYRLAPDHRAPVPAEDGIAVISHLVGAGIGRLAICGDSAGGAVALATEAAMPKDLRRHIVCAASFYGAFGLLDTASIRARGSRAHGTDRACVDRYFALAGRDAYSIDRLAKPSPVPVYLMAAEEDALRDDSLAMAEALGRQNRTVALDRVPGVDHGFLHGDDTNGAADDAVGRFAAWLRDVAGL